MLPPFLFKRHLKLSLLLFPATFMRRFPQLDTFITLQARTLLLTPTCTVCRYTPNVLGCFCIKVLLYQPQTCNPNKLLIYQHCSGKKQLGLPNKVFYVFQSVHSSCVTKNFQLQISETLLKIGYLVYDVYMYAYI